MIAKVENSVMNVKDRNDNNKINKVYSKYIKRFFDIIICTVGIILFWWVILIIAVLVKINMGSPIVYKSERMGRYEKPFSIYKFRSMTNEVDENGVLLPGSQRLTKFGRLLRSTSMDELPSLFNILKGDLSLIGPRPLLMKYQPYFYEHEKVRHLVRPGLTGWAQVNGRNALSWQRKFELDIEYTKKMSLLFDIKILFLTVAKVLMRSDIIQDAQQTGSLYIVRAEMISEDFSCDKKHTEGD
ncbi:sugar transferase [Eubacterium callanderi]|uniref:sugar transferase n=1 Tax=Eubacterium callanderi TaxID=53442 RepID=UPI00399AD3D3